MITLKDIVYVGKLAPIAQLLELLGHLDQPTVRSPDVFAAMSKELWEIYWYLNARLHDELLGCPCTSEDDGYFEETERRSKNAVE